MSESRKDELIRLVLHCFDMHDHPDVEAVPYIKELAALMNYEFDCLMAPQPLEDWDDFEDEEDDDDLSHMDDDLYSDDDFLP